MDVVELGVLILADAAEWLRQGHDVEKKYVRDYIKKSSEVATLVFVVRDEDIRCSNCGQMQAVVCRKNEDFHWG